MINAVVDINVAFVVMMIIISITPQTKWWFFWREMESVREILFIVLHRIMLLFGCFLLQSRLRLCFFVVIVRHYVWWPTTSYYEYQVCTVVHEIRGCKSINVRWTLSSPPHLTRDFYSLSIISSLVSYSYSTTTSLFWQCEL